jgi:deoxyadenosine/deoxycytidine kinase
MTTDPERQGPRIVVVGPCASGKSTLVSRLRGKGYDAHAVAQEHSAVRDLWKRKDPDALIALDVSLEEVRNRRSPDWLEAVYQRQHERLASAYAAADLTIDTAEHDADAVLAIVESWLGGSEDKG